MTVTDSLYADTLNEIAQILRKAGVGEKQPKVTGNAGQVGVQAPTARDMDCRIKPLPARLLKDAAHTAITINPVNAPLVAPLAQADAGLQIAEPERIVILTSKYWGPTPRELTVSFMENTPPDLRARIISHMNAWNTVACISFVETARVGEVRISRGGDGYWSYLGTDILHIPQDRPTMNLQGFVMGTDESEYRRVVCHETGHTLGFPHEHMRKELVALIDPIKAYDYFLQNYGWDKRTVDEQVLTPLDQRAIMGTPPDQDSIMCYQLPGSITKNGQPIRGGVDIDQTDYAFAFKIYPKPVLAPAGGWGDGWPESEDVPAPV
jgi:hypothetical protein